MSYKKEQPDEIRRAVLFIQQITHNIGDNTYSMWKRTS